jgi:uncharacterized protein (DUF1697 family)
MSSDEPMSHEFVALLRGINVAGKNKLPMAALSEIFKAAGCREVKTYIQSGNVVLTAPRELAAELPQRIQRAIHGEFGYKVPIIMRSANELEDVVLENPYVNKGTDIKRLHIGFMAKEPTGERINSLDPNRSPPDEFHVHGREIYLYLPNGMGRTKLTNAYFDSRLDTIITMRNWRTTLRLLEMAGG